MAKSKRSPRRPQQHAERTLFGRFTSKWPNVATGANVWQRGRGFRAVPPVRGPQRARPDTPQLAASYQPLRIPLGIVPEGQPQ